MNILGRNELISLHKKGILRIDDSDGHIQNSIDVPYSLENPFQQCSFDLHVGATYIPSQNEEEKGGAKNPILEEHILQPGHTVMIRTKEKVSLPDNIGGICFSPSRVALKAILIVNTGHVDPGYSGHLHFTAINMGRESFTLRAGDIVCTMLFFKLSEVVPHYGDEKFSQKKDANGKFVPEVIEKYLPKLSKDFMNVQERASAEAKKEVFIASLKQPIIVALITGGIALLGIIFTPLNGLRDRVSSLEQQLNTKTGVLEDRLNLESRLNKIEEKLSIDKK